MTSKEHHKHSKITSPHYGYFNRNEWGITGTHCSNIKTLAAIIIEALSGKYKCGYADAEHSKGEEQKSLPGMLANGAVTEYTNEINFHRFNFNASLNQFYLRDLFSGSDMVLVNGNHHEANAQVVVIDETKKESLKKRLSQLTNVQLILLADSSTEIFDFVKDASPYWKQLPIYKLNDTDRIIEFFKAKMKDSKPKLNGLVLAGGKSIRMGYDKSLIDWHGKEQKYFLADLLANVCSEVFISCRDEQQKETINNYKTIADSFTGLGPYGAILSAFREQPDASWLVVACDLPLLDLATLQFLKENRNSSSMATTFQSPHDNLPESLITIWEPRSYPVLLSFLSQGFTCPRKALINSNNVTILNAPDPAALKNVNTPEDINEVNKIISKQMMIKSGS